MNRSRLLFVVLVAPIAVCAQQLSSEPACAEMLRAKVLTDLQLPVQRFDQSSDEGWRVLSAASCFSEAADLIHKYLLANPSSHPIVRWHQAQMEASAGRTASAIDSAMASLRNAEKDAISEFRWNPYVLGTVAFLKGDLPSLVAQHSELLKAAAASPMNVPNASALGRLIACFGKPYVEAYSCKQ